MPKKVYIADPHRVQNPATDMHWLRECDAVLRFPGESNGADKEVAEAELLGIPVFYTMDDLQRAFSDELPHLAK